MIIPGPFLTISIPAGLQSNTFNPQDSFPDCKLEFTLPAQFGAPSGGSLNPGQIYLFTEIGFTMIENESSPAENDGTHSSHDPDPSHDPAEFEQGERRLAAEEETGTGLIDFQALLREGDVIIYDLIAGAIQYTDEFNWWGHFQVPRNSSNIPIPEGGRYYRLHLKDGRTGVIIIDRCLRNISGRYPTIQFHGASELR